MFSWITACKYRHFPRFPPLATNSLIILSLCVSLCSFRSELILRLWKVSLTQQMLVLSQLKPQAPSLLSTWSPASSLRGIYLQESNLVKCSFGRDGAFHGHWIPIATLTPETISSKSRSKKTTTHYTWPPGFVFVLACSVKRDVFLTPEKAQTAFPVRKMVTLKFFPLDRYNIGRITAFRS